MKANQTVKKSQSELNNNNDNNNKDFSENSENLYSSKIE